jgi:predicted DNA-binding transcriptional regulator AlpA
VPVSTIYHWRGRGEGPPALKVGKRLRFRADDVLKWLDDREGVD